MKTEKMRSTALITGASRGIGAEFAKIFASNGSNLILTARDEEDLMQLKLEIEKSHEVNIKIIVRDLSVPEQVQSLFDEIKKEKIQVDYLINNAGFGDYGYFEDSNLERQLSMLNLNINALTQLCHLFVQEWKDKKQGKILNVSSTASFQPGPGMSVYYASKAYVTSFSQALHYELKKRGISVTTLCPGPTKSNFAAAARVDGPNKLLKDRRLPSSRKVAKYGYRAMMKGKSLVIQGNANSFLAFMVRFMPRKLMTMISGKILEWK